MNLQHVEAPLAAPPGGMPPRRPVTYGDHLMRLMDMRERGTRLLSAIDDELLDMIERLDAMDGDPDLEPWLAGSDACARGYVVDAEDDADDEPSLGAPERTPPMGFGLGRNPAFNQTQWGQGVGCSEEEAVDEDGNDEQHEGECAQGTVDDEPDSDDEPSLGSTHDIDLDLGWSPRCLGCDGEAEETIDDLCFPPVNHEVREEQRRVVKEVADRLRKRRGGDRDPDEVTLLTIVGVGRYSGVALGRRP